MSSAGFRPAPTVRLLMLAAAYAPLLGLLGLLNSFRIGWLRWTLGGAAVASVVATVLFFAVAVPRRNAVPEQIYSARPREGEGLKFFASYVVPFFVTTAAPSTTRWALLLYLVLIAVLYMQGDLYFTNPLIAILGYRVFELTREDRGFLLVLSRQWRLDPRQVIALALIGGYVYVHLPQAVEGAKDDGHG